MTALALRYYAIGLPFYAFYKIFGPVFYILDRPYIPVVITIITLSLNITFCVLSVDSFGFSILALGTTLSMGVNSFLQMGILKKLLHLPFPATAGFFLECPLGADLTIILLFAMQRVKHLA